MRKILAATAAFLALSVGGSAYAADMPLKAPPAPPPVWSWTGFYVGANVGYSWGRSDVSLLYAAAATGNVLGAPNGTVHPNGFLGGVQAGYNWQFDRWVTGFETDIQGTNERDTITLVCPAGTCSTTNAVTASVTEKLNWFGTARLRLGYTVLPELLLYATGGLAYGRLTESGFITDATGTSPFSFSKTSLGWAAGVGAEGRITGRWTWKAEYLFLSLKEPDGVVLDPTITPPPRNTPPGVTVRIDPNFTDNILRVGANYHF
jgi:outer membrane immunogenic protein